MFLLSADVDTVRADMTCKESLFEMIKSTDVYNAEYRKFPKDTSKIKWTIEGAPDTLLFKEMTYSPSPTYDLVPFYALDDDQWFSLGSYSFDPSTSRLYLSENVGIVFQGEHKMKMVKRLKVDKKYLDLWLQCENGVQKYSLPGSDKPVHRAANTMSRKYCDNYIYEMILDTKEFQDQFNKAKDIDGHGELVIGGWHVTGSPDTTLKSSLLAYSPTIDLAPWAMLSYDEILMIEWFSFDPVKRKLYLSREVGCIDLGEHQMD
jgi:hypothetical protein